MSVKDSPENSPIQRRALRTRLSKAFRDRVLDLDVVADVIVAERAALRETIAGEILEPLIDRYDEGLNNDQMETLVWVVRHFVRDTNGDIILTKPPPNARKAGLRAI
jgi:hypothetical protein